MLHRIAHLAIGAPRRVLVVRGAGHGGRGHLRHSGGQEPVGRRVPGPDFESAQATRLLVGQVRPAAIWSWSSASPTTRPPGPRVRGQGRGHRHRRTARSVAEHDRGELGLDRARTRRPPRLISKDGKTGLIVAGITGGESGAQKHAKELTDQLVHDRDGVTVRAGGDGDDLRPDQRARAKKTC